MGVNGPDNIKILGGMKYDANLVKEAKDNGDGTFTINFNTGETLTYPEQTDFVSSKTDRTTYYKDENGEYQSKEVHTHADGGERLHTKYGESSADGTFTEPREASVTGEQGKRVFSKYSEYTIANAMGATFTSAKKVQTIVNLENSSDCMVDLEANNNRKSDVVGITGGANNKMKFDETDIGYIDDKKNDYSPVEGKGPHAQKNYYNVENKYYNNPKY